MVDWSIISYHIVSYRISESEIQQDKISKIGNLIFNSSGGASKEETDSGLFVYSTFPFIRTKSVLASSDNCCDVRDDSDCIYNYHNNNNNNNNNNHNHDNNDDNNNDDNNNNNNNNNSDNNNINNNTNNKKTSKNEKIDNDYVLNNKKKTCTFKNKIILRKNWDPNSRKFRWENIEKMISEPRIISQVRTVVKIVLTPFNR